MATHVTPNSCANSSLVSASTAIATVFASLCRPGALGAPLVCRALTSATLLGRLQFSTILDSYKQHSKGWSSTFNKYAEGEAGFLVGTLLYACLTLTSCLHCPGACLLQY